MFKSANVMGFIVASAGLAYVVNRIMDYKEHCSGWHKIKVEEKPTGESVSHKRTSSRYGSNPVQY